MLIPGSENRVEQVQSRKLAEDRGRERSVSPRSSRARSPRAFERAPPSERARSPRSERAASPRQSDERRQLDYTEPMSGDLLNQTRDPALRFSRSSATLVSTFASRQMALRNHVAKSPQVLERTPTLASEFSRRYDDAERRIDGLASTLRTPPYAYAMRSARTALTSTPRASGEQD